MPCYKDAETLIGSVVMGSIKRWDKHFGLDFRKGVERLVDCIRKEDCYGELGPESTQAFNLLRSHAIKRRVIRAR